MLTGSCLCGAVGFECRGTPSAPSVCHCSQCRKQSGHVWSSSHVPSGDLTITRDEGLTWFRATPEARRGFCRICGSFLFWELDGEGTISFSMGSLDGPTGLRLGRHIFVASKGDYYEIGDGVPQVE